MKRVTVALGWIVLLSCSTSLLLAEIPRGYYDKARGKTRYQLKTALHKIISKGYIALNYRDLYDAYLTTDNKAGDIVWDIYSDVPGGTPPYIYIQLQKPCGGKLNTDKEGNCYNREHILPQSWFGKKFPMKTDMYHVYPTDGRVNKMRSSFPFGEVSRPTWTSGNGSKLGPNTSPGYTGTAFEPIDAYKGDIARSFFYMAVRYQNRIAGWQKSWGSSQFVLNGTSNRVFLNWVIDLFLKWHKNDPVSQKEIDRNEAVFGFQHNRNPFIDYPHLAEVIWADGENPFSVTPAPEPTPTPTPTPTATPTPTPEPTPVPSPDGAVTLLDERFTTAPSGWNRYNVSGSKDWEFLPQGYAGINSFRGEGACDDWLISPRLNLDETTDERLSFETWTRYSDTHYPSIKVLYSTNYSGSGDPGTASWFDITACVGVAPQNSQTWTKSGSVSLSHIQGKTVFITFQYTSTGSGTGSSSFWKVDNI
ncbi:MAG: DUF5017 domain-containing protein, partial [bacterium]|nr:DUF5017 domain-containing protein [bacterium]